MITSAERILMDLGVQGPEDIDLEAIAWSLGAAVEYRSLEKCEALIVGGDRRAIITVNSKSVPVRRRFSIAHEIGHWHHHKGRVLFCGAQDIDNPASAEFEKQADHFASDLILPSFLVNPIALKLQRLTLSSIREIAETFQASATATLLKLIDLNFLPVLAVCHNKKGRRWFRRASMIPHWWFPQEELNAQSLAFDMVFGGALESRVPKRVSAGAWFDFRGAERFEIHEEAFRLPNGEVLTLLNLPREVVA